MSRFESITAPLALGSFLRGACLFRDFMPTPGSVLASVTRYAKSLSGDRPTSGLSEEERSLTRVEPCDEVPQASSPERIALPRSGNETYRGDASSGAKALAVNHAGGRGRTHVRAYERLRDELSPGYEAFFRNVVAHSDDGVRFIVLLRQVRLACSSRFFLARVPGASFLSKVITRQVYDRRAG